MAEERKTKFCSNCGAEIDINAKICPKCGVEQPIVPKEVSNWWYLAPIFLGVIGGLIAWAVNKDVNPKKAIKFLIVGIVLPIVCLILYIIFISTIVFTSVNKAKEKANAAQIKTEMSALRTEIEFYWDKENGYLGINCSREELSRLCNNIKESAGEMPTIKTSKENYCCYVKLPSGEYYCISSQDPSGRTTKIFPGKAGYCDGITFSCP